MKYYIDVWLEKNGFWALAMTTCSPYQLNIKRNRLIEQGHKVRVRKINLKEQG